MFEGLEKTDYKRISYVEEILYFACWKCFTDVGEVYRSVLICSVMS